jgi:Protein of unknown function (DUF3095)
MAKDFASHTTEEQFSIRTSACVRRLQPVASTAAIRAGQYKILATRVTNQGLARRKLELGVRSLASWAAFRFGLPIGRLRPSRYIGEMIANADFRKYGDALRITLDCTPKLVERFEARLRIAEQTRVAHFGLHQQRAVIADAQRPFSLRRRRRRGLYSSSSVQNSR